MCKDSFSATEVAKILGKRWSMRRVVDCTERGLCEPLEREQYRRGYSLKSIIQLALFEELRQWGYSRAAIKGIFQEIECSENVNDFYSHNGGGDGWWILRITESLGSGKLVDLVKYSNTNCSSSTNNLIGIFFFNIDYLRRKVLRKINNI